MNSISRGLASALFLGVAFMLAAGPAHAREIGEGDIAAIRKVITDQIEAFRRDDATAAYSFAAPEVQKLFPDETRFMNMVRTTYPAVYRARHVSFGKLSGDDGDVVQEVRLVGPKGKLWMALYRVARQPDGAWRIASVIMASTPGSAT